MKRIILDTNFLFVPFTFKVDILGEIARIMVEPYELCVLEETIEELNNLVEKTKGKEKDVAKLALEFVKKTHIKVIKSGFSNRSINHFSTKMESTESNKIDSSKALSSNKSSFHKQKSLYMKPNSKDAIVDDILVKIADNNTIVATQDTNLRKRLAESNIKTIMLRNKSKLEIR